MAELARWDGYDSATLARLLDVPRVVTFDSTASTMDDAHGLASVGAPAGSLVIADRQTAGRGRAGRRWASQPGQGIWMTLVERPNDVAAIEVLSLRLGLRAARVLDRYAERAVRLKWPNDLYVGDGKLAGVLVEARWRGDRVDWVAIGIGVNVHVPQDVATAAGLRPGTVRAAVLTELVPALRGAAAARGALTDAELAEFADRDLAIGRSCVAPAAGYVQGITPAGALEIRTPDGVRTFRDGSLIFAGAAS